MLPTSVASVGLHVDTTAFLVNISFRFHAREISALICEHDLDQIDMVINAKNRAACALTQEMIFRVMPFEPLMELQFRGLTN